MHLKSADGLSLTNGYYQRESLKFKKRKCRECKYTKTLIRFEGKSSVCKDCKKGIDRSLHKTIRIKSNENKEKEEIT